MKKKIHRTGKKKKKKVATNEQRERERERERGKGEKRVIERGKSERYLCCRFIAIFLFGVVIETGSFSPVDMTRISPSAGDPGSLLDSIKSIAANNTIGSRLAPLTRLPDLDHQNYT